MAARREPKKTGFRKPLDEIDEGILRHVLSTPGITQVQVARLIGQSPRNVSRRMRNYEFRERLKAESAKAVDRAVDATAEAILKLKALHTRAVETLGQLMETSESDSVKLNAAKAIIDGLPEVAAGTIKQVGKEPEVTEEDVIEAAKFLVQSKGDTPKDEG